MLNNRSFFKVIAILSLFAICSCTNELHEVSGNEENTDAISSKLVFTSNDAVVGELLVYFSEDAVRRVEAFQLTRSAEEAVLTRSGIESFDSVLDYVGVKSVRRLFPSDSRHVERERAAGLHRWYIVEFDESMDLDVAARAMAGVSEVSKVEFNQKTRLIGPVETGVSSIENPVETMPSTKASGVGFNDPYLNRQWHYVNTGDRSIYSGIKAGADVNCAEAWQLCVGDPRVVVAVVDEGVQWDHPDLRANMWTNTAELNGQAGVDDDGNGFVDDIYGYDFVNDGELTYPEDHGTHVAGTVAAVNNNGEGVCGVAGGSGDNDGVKIMSCQVFHGTNGGGAAETSRAIKYAADNGAVILQCSFGYPGGSITSDDSYANSQMSAEKQAIDYFIGTKNCDAVDGGIVIFAAGNDMVGMSGYPGAYKDYISVTAMSCDYTPAYYTNYGPGCNIAAPGGDAYQSLISNGTTESMVFSTVAGGKYGYMQGTSMACPHVSGVAALGLSYALKLGKTFSKDEFNSILLTSVNNIDQYCVGQKQYYTNTGGPFNLSLESYKRNMGIGYIDAYQVLMNVRGITCVPVEVGKQTRLDVRSFIGSGDANVRVADVSVSREDMTRLGMTSEPTVFANTILLNCAKTGSAILSVKIIAGVGDGRGMNGMQATKEFAIIARNTHSENGGWL